MLRVRPCSGVGRDVYYKHEIYHLEGVYGGDEILRDFFSFSPKAANAKVGMKGMGTVSRKRESVCSLSTLCVCRNTIVPYYKCGKGEYDNLGFDLTATTCAVCTDWLYSLCYVS